MEKINIILNEKINPDSSFVDVGGFDQIQCF
jgi:hypothetical protein